MTCAEFQRDLPYIIDGGGTAAHEEHLRLCAVCSDLVSDLRYIAEQAKLLVPMESPSPRVWDGISKSLEREGLVKPAQARRGLLGPQRSRWGWLLPMTILLLLGVGLFVYRSKGMRSAEITNAPLAEPVPAPTAAVDEDDQQVLQAVADRDPALRQNYEDNLNQVNLYISDAKQSLQDDPSDGEARQYLMQAYEQKNMLYQMATRPAE
ncbi:MAG TPA: hypothetical protein VN622_02250 [Clostridia bacterium]|nr:hypothetical protein [Clostridia bacterium]